MLGLKRETVMLLPHQKEWIENAGLMIKLLKKLLGSKAVDVQHIGSTAIPAIHAKPIIDLVVGVYNLSEISSESERLSQHGIVFRGEDVAGQLLFVAGDFEKDTRTHHIHVVQWNGKEWNHYINFRDYLNYFPEKAKQYDANKQKLALQYPNDRKRYTAEKQQLIAQFLKEAEKWRAGLLF